MSTNKPYGFYERSFEEIKKAFYAGYKAQLKAGLGLACQLFIDKEKGEESDYKILNFGLPGTGKTLYPMGLVNLLNEDEGMRGFFEKVKRRNPATKTDFYLFRVKCLSIATSSQDPSFLRTALTKLENHIRRKTPALVVLDELDAFALESKVRLPVLTHWTMKFLDKNYSGVGVLGIVNKPAGLDLAVSQRFHQKLYFELPDEETVAKILEHFDIPFHKDVARKLCKNPVEGKALECGCKYLIKFKAKGKRENLKTLSADDIVDYMEDFVNSTWKDVENYENENDFFITKSKKTLTFWDEVRKTLMN